MSSKRRSKSLNRQAREILSIKTAYGESRSKAKLSGEDKNKIYSISTYNNYIRHCDMFITWLKENHPDVTSIKKSEKYYSEYLHFLEFDKTKANGDKYSPYSVNLSVAALGKLFGIHYPDSRFYVVSTKREKGNITRSRIPTKSDKHFSVTNNWEIVQFGKATGLRKNKELRVIKGKDGLSRKELEGYSGKQYDTTREKNISTLSSAALEMFPDSEFFIYVVGKGGKPRLVPIMPEDYAFVYQKFAETPPERKVFEHIPAAMDEHSYRAYYAKKVYKHYAREISEIPYDRINKGSGKRYQSDVYVCRSDEKGKKLDKRAMHIASQALGHNRISVIADHYLYGL